MKSALISFDLMRVLVQGNQTRISRATFPRAKALPRGEEGREALETSFYAEYATWKIHVT